MRLRVLGSNGTYPTPGRPASGYLVSAGGTTIMLDAGPGTAMVLQEAIDTADLGAIVISHIHADHCSDLFAIFDLYRYGTGGPVSIPVFVPDGAAEHLASFVRAGPGHDLFAVFDFRTVSAGDEAVVGALKIEFGSAKHPVPSLVTGVEHDGRRLVYSGDTGPGGDLEAMAGGVALLLVEATYQGIPGPDRWPYHLAALEAGEIARRAEVERLVVCHVSPSLDPQQSVVEAAETYGGPVEWAAPGWETEV